MKNTSEELKTSLSDSQEQASFAEMYKQKLEDSKEIREKYKKLKEDFASLKQKQTQD